MKITYIHQHFHLPSEGGGSRPYEFARRLAADGHRVTMICAGDKELEQYVDGEPNFLVKRLAIGYDNAMNVPQRMWAFARFMLQASKVAVAQDADVVFASSTPLTAAVPGMMAHYLRRTPFVFEVRDLWPEVPVELGFLKNPVLISAARLLEKAAYASSRSIVALSPGMREGVVKVAPRKAVTVIPNACDPQTFDKPAQERTQFRQQMGWGDEFVVAYAGGFGHVYQLEWAVELAGKLNEKGVRFVLLGEGSSTPKLTELARDRGLDPRELLPGKKAKTVVAQYIAAADTVLSPLRSDPCLEPCSLNKVFDGLAAGRPVLLNHGGWLTEAVTQAGAGWKLPRDISSAAQVIEEIAGDRSACEQAGERARELGKKRFNRDDLYHKLRGVLEEAAGEKEA